MVRCHGLLAGLSAAIVLSVIVSSTHAAGVPTGATAYYELAGDANDSSGNGAHGVLPGGSEDPGFVFDAARGKTVAVFDGVDDSIDVTASGAELTDIVGTPNVLAFTVAFWVKFENVDSNTNSVPDINVVMGTFAGNAMRTTVELVGDLSWAGFGTDGGIGVVSGPSGGDARAFNDTAGGGAGAISLFDEQWHHVVIAWEDEDGDPALFGNDNRYDTMIWIDNQATDTDTNSGDYGGGDRGNVQLYLGRAIGSNGGPIRYLSGALSDVVFYERKLSGSEVGDLYAATVPEPSSMLLALLAAVGTAACSNRRRR